MHRSPPNVLSLVNKGLAMYQWKQDIGAAERCCHEALRVDPECEAYMRVCDPPMERLYFATGFGLIQCVKGLMSYADEVRGCCSQMTAGSGMKS